MASFFLPNESTKYYLNFDLLSSICKGKNFRAHAPRRYKKEFNFQDNYLHPGLVGLAYFVVKLIS